MASFLIAWEIGMYDFSEDENGNETCKWYVASRSGPDIELDNLNSEEEAVARLLEEIKNRK
jgi:hypothetical protein